MPISYSRNFSHWLLSLSIQDPRSSPFFRFLVLNLNFYSYSLRTDTLTPPPELILGLDDFLHNIHIKSVNQLKARLFGS